jgi:hypothetical protein
MMVVDSNSKSLSRSRLSRDWLDGLTCGLFVMFVVRTENLKLK